MRLHLACLCERAVLRGNTVDLNSIAAQIITNRLPCVLGAADYKPKTVLVWVDVERAFVPLAVLHDPRGGRHEFTLPRVPGDGDTAVQSLALDGVRLEHAGLHRIEFSVDGQTKGELTFKVLTASVAPEALYA